MEQHFLKMHIPQEGLYGRILEAINKEELRMAKKRAYYSFVTTIGSLIMFIATGAWFYTDAVHTGLLQSLSLTLSDGSLVLQYWQNFLASLLEMLPFMSLVACLVSVWVVLVSFRIYARERSRSYSHIKVV